MTEGGHNPLRWDCKERGCFNWKQRPKIEVFSECFPGRINFGDVDGIVEIAGNGLLLEWKGEPKEIPTGQRIMYQRLTADGALTVIMLAGDARTMDVTHYRSVWQSKLSAWEGCTLDEAKEHIRKWCAWAQGHQRDIRPNLKLVGNAP